MAMGRAEMVEAARQMIEENENLRAAYRQLQTDYDDVVREGEAQIAELEQAVQDARAERLNSWDTALERLNKHGPLALSGVLAISQSNMQWAVITMLPGIGMEIQRAKSYRHTRRVRSCEASL